MEKKVLVLVVEDDDIAVSATRSAEKALQILEGEMGACRAIITDIEFQVRKIDGWDLARKARELVPDIGVIYTTGARGFDWPANGVPNSILIQKPFAAAQVVTAVSQILNAGQQAPPPVS